MEEDERKSKEATNESQDLDPICSPHLEERLIGGDVDLDLLSLFPQEGARIIGGIERKQAFGGQQWRAKLARKVGEPLGKKTP